MPLHAADLSGYGLSCFSDWHLADAKDAFGVTQVRLDVMVGRTAYEVVEMRSVLAPCQAHVVRTIVIERRNSGRIQRFDSGWQAIDDGLFKPYAKFETGVLKALRRIRNIRILDQPKLVLDDPAKSEWQPVLFDADAEIDDIVAGGSNGRVSALGQRGYIQLKPAQRTSGDPSDAPTPDRLAALFAATGPIGGPIDCRIRLGGTLDMHLSALAADIARNETAPLNADKLGFAVAVHGAPTLPRAGQWSVVRVDGKTSDVSPVDPQQGVPVVGRAGQPFIFRDARDARHDAVAAEYGLLQTTAGSRVLFQRPTIDPLAAGQLKTAPPLIADAMSLVQASGAFPRSAFALQVNETPLFEVSAADDWRLTNPKMTFVNSLGDVAAGAAWNIARGFPKPDPLTLAIDSAVPNLPWALNQPVQDIALAVAGETLLTISGRFEAVSGALPKMPNPSVVYGKAFDELIEILNALKALLDLPFDLNIDVTAGMGSSPSFTVRVTMKFGIGTPDDRIEIGMGKFFGLFEIDGTFTAKPGSDSHGGLRVEFNGDVQQAIIPPLIYAGGLFHFVLEVKDSGEPVIELGLGTTTSLGGDLIPGLVEVEATIKYGYMLLPKTLQPGVILGIEARALLLAGLFGLSFSADAMAHIARLNHDDKTVRIAADIRVAGSIQVAIFFKKRVDFHAQFEQNLPLTPLLIGLNANPLAAAAASAVI